jgi:hypothetical protein
LGELGHPQCNGDLPDRDIKLDPEEAIEEKDSEANDLIEAGIPPEDWLVWLARTVVLPH